MHYRAGMTVQKQLALKVGVSEKTMSKWVREGEWEKLRMNIPLVKQEQLQAMLTELQQLNEFISTKPEGLRYADSKEADIRRKLVADIEALEGEAGIADTISVANGFTRWLAKVDVEKAQEIGLLLDSYIKEILR